MSGPVRVQLSRRKGWRMPENTVKVDRTTRWGNPFIVDPIFGPETAVNGYRAWITMPYEPGEPEPARRHYIIANLRSLRGKNLACWCPLDQPCHADVLLELANAPLPSSSEAVGQEKP